MRNNKFNNFSIDLVSECIDGTKILEYFIKNNNLKFKNFDSNKFVNVIILDFIME